MPNSIVYENIRLDPGQRIGLRYYNLNQRELIDSSSHFHMMPEVLKFKTAQGLFIINGKEFTITPRTLVFVPSMAVHEMYLSEEDKEFYLLQFEQSVYMDLNVESFNTLGNRPLAIELSEEENRWIDSLFEWGNSVIDDCKKMPLHDSIMRLILLFIYDKIQSLNIQEDALEQNKIMAKMYPLIKHLEETQRFSISLDEAAAMCGLSRFHFSRLFKSFFKTHFKDYLLKRKISAAITLLSSSELNISEIAYKCEFSDTAYFSQKFKEVLKQTPSEFRKSLVKTEEFVDSKNG